jgi:6-phosphogluconolactonase (cycloisomerase 2 family)
MFDQRKSHAGNQRHQDRQLKAVGHRPRLAFGLLFFALCLLLPVEVRGQFVYVNNEAARNRVSGFRISPNGTLTPVAGSPFETNSLGGRVDSFSNATITVTGDFVFACNTVSRTVSGFKINADGSLAMVAGSPFATGGGFPIAVTANRQGTLLFVANRDTDTVSAFQIGSTGALSPVPGSPFNLRPLRRPTGLAITSTGTFLLVGGQRAWGSYRISPDGSLTAVGPPMATELDMQALVITPNDRFVYATDAEQNTVGGWRLSADGQLTAVEGSPYSVGEAGNTLGLALNPRGNLLFVTVAEEAKVYVFRVTSGGALQQAILGSPFSTTGSELKPLGVSPNGDFLYAIDVIDRLIHVFRINSFGPTLTETADPAPTGLSAGRPSGLAFK